MESDGGLQRREKHGANKPGTRVCLEKHDVWSENAHAPNLLVDPTTTHCGNTSGGGTTVGGGVGQDHPRMVKNCMGEKDTRDFETCALDNMKHSVKQRPKIGEEFKTQKWKAGACGHCDLHKA